METKDKIIIVLLALIVTFQLTSQFNIFDKVGITTTQYKYRVEYINDISFDALTAELGREGWEIVNARRAKGESDYDYGYELILKKKK